MKREHGLVLLGTEAVAAPATVCGEPYPDNPLTRSWLGRGEKGADPQARRPARAIAHPKRGACHWSGFPAAVKFESAGPGWDSSPILALGFNAALRCRSALGGMLWAIV